MSPAFLTRLQQHAWPGNVRELKATLDRALLLARGGELQPKHLMFSKHVGTAEPAPVEPAATPSPDPTSERDRIIEALNACAGNETRAAKLLGISRATLTTKLTLYRIPRPHR